MAVHNREFDTNFEILRENLRETGAAVEMRKCNRPEELRSIEELPHPYHKIFSEYSNFNRIQSKVIDDVLYADDSLVLSAPTGSGKTVIFELAIVRLLMSLEHNQSQAPFKIVYICPMKALCEERLVDWHTKFSNFGINAIAVTGDSERVEFKDLLNHNLIITTPEKWDCLTRKWRENINLVRTVKLFMIDEIHLLNDDGRGSTLEAIVCRMKTIEKEENDSIDRIRFLAVSATVPNIEDVAEWFGESAKCHKFSDDYRPVKLNKIVLGYNHWPKVTPFKFDLSLNYKLPSLIMQYSHAKPTLIFCSTRKIVEMTAKHILQHLTINLKPEQKQCLFEASSSVADAQLRETLFHGIAYHHAGMLPQTKRAIENLFRNGDLPVLVTTSTLAVGVNLPAHLVIVKSTKFYSNGGFKDYSETAILQMIGRAGRPQFDTEATALILTSARDKEKFVKMIGGLQPVESDLHRHLIEHLNAEVVLQTITDLEVAMRWLSSTFLYIRARKNPRYYGLTSSDPTSIDRRLLDMCQIELNKLIKAGMLTIDQDVLLRANPVGAAMAKYYLYFETMKLFTQISGSEILQQILSLISKCYEFSAMYLRVNDKKSLNLLNKCRDRQTIRFPLNGKIKTLDMKINCLIQAVLGCLDICDHSLLSETLKIMRNGERIVRCLIEYLESKDKCFQALLNTIILAKCFRVKMWENSPYVSKQLPGIGTVMSTQLVNAGKTTFKAILATDPREIEILINKKPPFGSKLQEQIQYLPKYSLGLESYGKNKVKLTISLDNATDLERTCTANKNSLMFLLVGDSCNNVLLYEKYSHSFLIEAPDVVRFIDFQESGVEDLQVYFISEDWVGLDCTTKLEIAPKAKAIRGKSPRVVKKAQNGDLTYMQKFMEMYMQCKKTKDDQAVQTIANSENIEFYPEEKDQKKNVFNESNNSKIIVHGNVTIVDKNGRKPADTRLKLRAIDNVGHVPSPGVTSFVHKRFKSDENSSGIENRSREVPSVATSPVKVGDVKRKFAFTPKLFPHKRSIDEDKSSTATQEGCFEPPAKRQDIDNKNKNLKITWRSPLTYSPSVKFSPKVDHNRSIVSYEQNSFSTSRASSSNSTITTNQEAPLTHKTRPSSASQRTPLGLNSSQKVIFPLSDKAYEVSSLASTEDSVKNEEVLDKFGDVFATSFLESFGLIQSAKKPKLQSHLKTPNEYYHQLLTQTPNQGKASTQRKQISRMEEDRDDDISLAEGQNKKRTEMKIMRRDSENKKVPEVAREDEMRRQVVEHAVDQRKIGRVKSRSECEDRQQQIFSKPERSESSMRRSLPNLRTDTSALSSTQSRYFNQSGPSISTMNVSQRANLQKSSRSAGLQIATSPKSSNRRRPSFAEYPSFANEAADLPEPEAAFLPGHQRVSHESDPFNDSLDAALMECYIPSPIYHEEQQQVGTMSRWNSESFGDFGDADKGPVRCRPQTQLLQTLAILDGHERCVSRRGDFEESNSLGAVIDDEEDFFDDRMSLQMSDCATVDADCARRDSDLNYQFEPQVNPRDYQQTPQNYHHDPPRARHKYREDLVHSSQNNDFNQSHRNNFRTYLELPHTVQSDHPYARDLAYPRNDEAQRSYFPEEEVCRPWEVQNCRPSSTHRPQDFNNEGYSYIRYVMDKENDPFQGRDVPPDSRMRGFEAAGGYHRERAPMEDRMDRQYPNHFADVTNYYEYENPVYRQYREPAPMERYVNVPPPLEPYPQLAASFPDRRQREHYEPSPRPRAFERDDKYMMRRFFRDMDREQEE